MTAGRLTPRARALRQTGGLLVAAEARSAPEQLWNIQRVFGTLRTRSGGRFCENFH